MGETRACDAAVTVADRLATKQVSWNNSMGEQAPLQTDTLENYIKQDAAVQPFKAELN